MVLEDPDVEITSGDCLSSNSAYIEHKSQGITVLQVQAFTLWQWSPAATESAGASALPGVTADVTQNDKSLCETYLEWLQMVAVCHWPM